MKLFLFVSKGVESENAREIVNEVSEKFMEVDVRELDIDKAEGKELAKKYKIKKTPAVVLSDKLLFHGEVPKKDKLVEEIQKGKARVKWWSPSGLEEHLEQKL
ncbi:MAG: thioredoxin family protein [Candidatus Micrarchaeota archaeon]|nr:thioredoxin family protein [Candidatus Micrarchaeota archaeon]